MVHLSHLPQQTRGSTSEPAGAAFLYPDGRIEVPPIRRRVSSRWSFPRTGCEVRPIGQPGFPFVVVVAVGAVEGAKQLSAEFHSLFPRTIRRDSTLGLPARPDSRSSWCQPSTAPATHQDQGDGDLRMRSRPLAPSGAPESPRAQPTVSTRLRNDRLRATPKGANTSWLTVDAQVEQTVRKPGRIDSGSVVFPGTYPGFRPGPQHYGNILSGSKSTWSFMT